MAAELDIERIESSFRVLASGAAELAEAFYAELFRREPALRALFGGELAEQRRKLVASLALIVASLREPEKLARYLRRLGAGHRDAGVRAEHYPLVGAVLLGCIRERAGLLWDPPLERAWTQTYAALQCLMLEGAAQPPER